MSALTIVRDAMRRPSNQTLHEPHAGRARSAVSVGLLLTLFTFAATGCHSKSSDSIDAAALPNLSPTRAPSARTTDELWRRAGEGDPADLARLADREGAMGLLDGLEEGGAIGVAALDALPFADDAEAAYQRLAEILRQIDPDQSPPFLTAVAAIARRPRLQTEPVDPAGLRSCATALLPLAQRQDLPSPLRITAIGALRLLAERNGVDRAAIPTDLDAR